jgi:methionyl-tRNA formyltransferase
MTPPLRVVFMGTPDFAVPSLNALVDDARVNVVGVISQPDRRAGRGKKHVSPPVVVAARQHGIAVMQPETMRAPEAVAAFAAWAPDLAVVAAFGQILKPNVLEIPRLGCVNVHASLLPRWRGAAPIHRAIAAGDATTGVAIMQMEAGLDAGPVWRMDATMIGDDETAGELHDRLAAIGAAGLVAALDAIRDGATTPEPQPNTRTTYARMLTAADRRVPLTQTATAVVCGINGMSPAPGARYEVGDEIVTVLRARHSAAPSNGLPGTVLAADAKHGLLVACVDGAVEWAEVKRPGKRAMAARDALHGMAIAPGAIVRPSEG